MASNKLIHLLVIGLVLVLTNNIGVESALAKRRTTSKPSHEIAVNNTQNVATASSTGGQPNTTGTKRTLRRRIKSTTTPGPSSDSLAITPSTLSVALDTRSTLSPSSKIITSDTSQSQLKVEKPVASTGSATKTRKPTLAPAMLSHGDARVHDTPMDYYDGTDNSPSEPEDAFYSYSERQSFDSLVADEPSFSSSEQYSLIPPARYQVEKLDEQPTKEHKRETAQQLPKSHQANSDQGSQRPERCQKIYKPMPSHAHPRKKLMMTCYVCGKKDQPYDDGGYLEECNYSPTQRQNVYANLNGQSPYIGSQYAPIYKEQNGPYEGDATPQATSHSNSGGSSNGKGDKCKVYYKGHMKCTSCDDGSGAYSDQCDYEANDPGKHHQSAYNYGTQNGKTYGKRPSGDGYGNSGSGNSGYGGPSGGGGGGGGSGGYGYGGSPYGDEDSYSGGGGGGDGYGSSGYSGYPYASGTSNTGDDYSQDDYYGPDYGKEDSYGYNNDDGGGGGHGNGGYSSPKSGSDSYSHSAKGGDASGKDSGDNGKATTNNCHIVYKDMTSYSPYIKKGSKPKMKCMVCEGKDGTTEECNYSGGGNSSPGASSDYAAIYSPAFLDEFTGFLI